MTYYHVMCSTIQRFCKTNVSANQPQKCNALNCWLLRVLDTFNCPTQNLMQCSMSANSHEIIISQAGADCFTHIFPNLWNNSASKASLFTSALFPCHFRINRTSGPNPELIFEWSRQCSGRYTPDLCSRCRPSVCDSYGHSTHAVDARQTFCPTGVDKTSPA
jgi:hypothetical protein